MNDIEAELSVGRESLVALAQLLGSDYTDGVHGVGIVNAMETVAAYGGSTEGLQRFARWAMRWRGGSGEEGGSDDDDKSPYAAESAERTADRERFERRHKTVRRNWVLPAGFPARVVADAYLRPSVDSSEAPCQWSRPDLHGLRLRLRVHVVG